MNLKIDLQKKDKKMTKGLMLDLEKAKYKQRIPKAGGGFRYIYDDGETKAVVRHQDAHNKWADEAEKYVKKSLGVNNMNKSYPELNDFLKSTIEDESQPTIGTGKEQGDAMGLAGKGANKGNPETGSSSPELGGTPKPKIDKLSEDDEVDEKAVKPHKKPIEKSLPLSNLNQVEYMQREHRMYYNAHNSDDGEHMYFSKSEKTNEDSEDTNKSLSSDDQAAELVKSGNLFAGSNNGSLGFHNQLVMQHQCPHCESMFMKALTVCPYCGK